VIGLMSLDWLAVMLWQGLESKAFRIIPNISACEWHRHTTPASEDRGSVFVAKFGKKKINQQKTPNNPTQQCSLRSL